MSTPYVFSDEVPTLLSVANDDILLIWDTSAGRMKRCTVSVADALVDARGTSSATVVGYYGETGVDQGQYAGTAVTALTTAVMSAGNAAGVWAWASSTEAKAFAARAPQAQVDLANITAKLENLGLVAVSGN